MKHVLAPDAPCWSYLHHFPTLPQSCALSQPTQSYGSAWSRYLACDVSCWPGYITSGHAPLALELRLDMDIAESGLSASTCHAMVVVAVARRAPHTCVGCRLPLQLFGRYLDMQGPL